MIPTTFGGGKSGVPSLARGATLLFVVHTDSFLLFLFALGIVTAAKAAAEAAPSPQYRYYKDLSKIRHDCPLFFGAVPALEREETT